jgi:hypothetical protein
MDTDVDFGALRSLVQQPRSRQTWEQVCALTAHVCDPATPGHQEVIAYLDSALPTWSVQDRVMPKAQPAASRPPVWWAHVGWVDTSSWSPRGDLPAPGGIEAAAAGLDELDVLGAPGLTRALVHGLWPGSHEAVVPWMPAVEELTVVGAREVCLDEWAGRERLRTLRLYGCTLDEPVDLPGLERLELLDGDPWSPGMQAAAWAGHVPASCRVVAGFERPALALAVIERSHKGAPEGSRWLGCFTGDRIVIGKSPAADLQLRHRALGRRHANITWEAGRPVVEDRASYHGCFVGEQRVERAHPLRPGDDLRIADYLMRAALVPRRPYARGWEPWLFDAQPARGST